MEQQAPLPKFSKPPKILKISLIVVSAIVIVLALLLAGSALNLNCPFGIFSDKNNSFEAGWQAARQKIEGSGLILPEPEEIFTLAGTITSVAENKISLKANPTVMNPLADQAPEIRIVIIGPETKIIKLTPKSPEQIDKESEAFRKATEKPEPDSIPPTPPSLYTEEKIKITDIKIGDNISVASDTNIKMAAEFTAKEISINVTPERPSPPTP